ncbi:hypothetical protein NSIN_20843 [Nitrosotalea sinensis]|jgi:transketolase|uniref:Uncharacterized protein n=1 Tax=Nitrosotalea sinensis TaxID=1499975 RepID=A0A2H1EH12_9ARCH|nr:hypothetical protein [Candidatus Nitrosotalea sinensis]SHO45978.1 hypothetical protein NSIN_20843 [Candidatus Nitrosotalea sinensis]
MQSSSDENSNDDNRRSDIVKIKKELEESEKKFYKELSSKYFLLNEFTINQLKDMCTNLLGKGPDIEYHEDKQTKKMIPLPQYKEDYIHFIIEEFEFSEIKQYALGNHIVTSQFFEK